ELIHESSPYLLQHAHNPVNWHPWGEKALNLARKDNKLIIISIGYSACHWCHVMEHESFEDTSVAAIMNKHFISIKVDREERPDVDQVYMDAVQLISGQGGWPLNAFALPDGKPFYAGTYFRKEDWIKVLQYFVDQYEKDPEKLTEQAENVTNGLRSIEQVPDKSTGNEYTMEQLDRIFSNLQPHLDMRKGGINRAPKFPMPVAWKYLMHYDYLGGEKKAHESVISTLDNMAMGGIYDHVGGGFARYSTDADWHVPHFEKMLYDNAQLMELYARGYQITGDPIYRDVVYETHEFIQRELSSGKGGFYASLDADSEGEEGKYYVWTLAEIEKVLGKEAALFSDYYNLSEQGNWEHGKNIFIRKNTDSKIAEKHGFTEEELKETIKQWKTVLLKERSRRIAPGLDDKILTSWNALMAKTYAYIYQAFAEPEFLDIALKSARFLETNAMGDDLQMTRNYKNGKSSIPAFLDDYAFTISAFIEIYRSTFDESWLKKAEALTDYTLEHFLDEQTGMFFYTHDKHSNLIVRKKDISDNVIPSSNSEMAKNLF
ncbi:MAG: thioredoxin domain-containing protein, partial [Bacteroidales bacterium]|nr:thioredoxin domain-containing protein [Bacteroidales bacterium]